MARALPCLLLVLGLALAGCGRAGYDTSGLEKLIRDRLDQHRGFDVQSVSCPAHAKRGHGVVVRCTARLRDGHVVGVRATQLDDKGTVHLVADELFADNVERGIAQTLAAGGAGITARCPPHIPVVLGRSFDCALTGGLRRGRAVVTIVDGDGGFRLRFVR